MQLSFQIHSVLPHILISITSALTNIGQYSLALVKQSYEVHYMYSLHSYSSALKILNDTLSDEA